MPPSGPVTKVRKSGPSWAKKGSELGQKGEVQLVGAFVCRDTNLLYGSYHIPPGQTVREEFKDIVRLTSFLVVHFLIAYLDSAVGCESRRKESSSSEESKTQSPHAAQCSRQRPEPCDNGFSYMFCFTRTP